MNALILIRGIKFLLDNDIRMGLQEVFVIKRDMPDDPVCYFGLFSVTKVSIPEESKMVISAFIELMA